MSDEIHFHITAERIDNALTLDMLAAPEEFEEGIFKPRVWRDLLATFVVDEHNHYLPDRKARQLVGKLKGPAFEKACEDFATAFREYILPKESGTQSSLPSKPAADLDRDGATS